MSHNSAVAVVAASFAIYSLEEGSLQYQRKTREDPKTPMTRLMTRKEEPFKQQASMKMQLAKDNRGPSSARPAAPSPAIGSRKAKESSRRSLGTNQADAWERAEMGRIQKKSEKMNFEILSWENERRMKARRRMESKKTQLEARMTLNLQHFQRKITWIEQIADGARAQVQEKRRHEESKVRERSKEIRSTGRVPVKCFCF